MARSVVLGIFGDSGAGKTTVTRGLVRVLGEDQVAAIRTDDYLRYDRRQRAERNITPLDPECSYLDVLAQDLAHLRRNEPILKPVYRYTDGTFDAPAYVEPARFVVVEGLLGFHSRQLINMFDVRVYLDPPEELRRHWKMQHDSSRRGYTTDQVLAELDRREPDSERYIRPQRHHADIIVTFQPAATEDPEHLACALTLRDTLTHPDLTEIVSGRAGEGIALVERQGTVELVVSGRIPPEHVARVEETIWQQMQFGGDLRAERLGEFTVGTELHRSDSLAIVQLLILYHLVGAAASAGDNSEDRSSVREPRRLPPTGSRMSGAVAEAAPLDDVASPADGSAHGGGFASQVVEAQELKRWVAFFGLPALIAAIFVGLTFGTGHEWYLGGALGAVICDIPVMIWLALSSDTNRNSAKNAT